MNTKDTKDTKKSNTLMPKKRMSRKRIPEDDLNWAVTRIIIGELLRKHYQACATEELPPRLRAVLKKLDSEEPERPEDAPH
jgi:hypothetical protein